MILDHYLITEPCCLIQLLHFSPAVEMSKIAFTSDIQSLRQHLDDGVDINAVLDGKYGNDVQGINALS